MNMEANHKASFRKTILVVDDHELVLRGMKQILCQSFPDMDIAVAMTGEEAMTLLKHKPLELLSLDLELADMSGFRLIDEVREKNKSCKILVNTVHDEVWTVKRLADKYVEGIIFKSARAQSYVDAVRTILRGGVCYDVRARMLMRSLHNQMAAEASLTTREIEVLRLIADGSNTEEIAQQLGVKANTIETHRRRLLDKLSVRNSAELVGRAFSSGIISPME